MNFDAAFDVLLKHEGDFSAHKSDPGGKTRYGITEAVARRVGYRGDMRELPLDLAKRIYREDYWQAVRAEQLPPAIRYAVFDAAVNSGPAQSVCGQPSQPRRAPRPPRGPAPALHDQSRHLRHFRSWVDPSLL